MARVERHADNSSVLNILGRLVVNVVALLIVEYIIPGFVLTGLQAAVVAAVVIGVVNTFIRPIVQLIALPFSILTLGIVAFLINVGLLMLSAAVVPGFEIDGFITAAISSILLSLVGAFLNKLAK